MTEVAVLDDWQRAARGCADWSKLGERAEVTFFSWAFAGEDDAASRIADFDILLTMRERTPLPRSLIERLPRLRMLGITGAKKRCARRGRLHRPRRRRLQYGRVMSARIPRNNSTTRFSGSLAIALMIAPSRCRTGGSPLPQSNFPAR